MLTMRLFPRNIRTQIMLPLQWLNVTFNAVRLNSSSSGSDSESDSDSNSDTNSTKNTKVINRDDATKSNSFKSIEYLTVANKKYQRGIEKKLNKATNTLLNTVTQKDKEKVISDILTTISQSQRNYPLNTSNNYKSKTNYKINYKNEKEPSVIRTLQSELQKSKYAENQFRTEYDAKTELSVIRTLQSKQQKSKHAENQFKTEYDAETEPSVIRTLQSKQQKSKHAEHQFRTEYDAETEPSVIRTLQSELQKSKLAKSQFKAEKITLERKSSVFRTRQLKTKSDKEEQRDDVSIECKPIFEDEFTETSVVPKFKIWNKCEENELQILTTRYPKNAFEEMINWTEEGKLWRFPIDNEQGMEEEKEIHFSKHVFLDKHLEGWCPVNGPIRHFMELVCVGLSKNPYMTIKEKEEHIMWYKDYFGSKKDLLKELGAIE